MSVIVIGRLKVDPAEVRRIEQSRTDEFRQVAADARAAGCVHHRFAFGTNEVVLIDEWPNAEAFQAFFQNPTVASFMQDAGVQGPPDISIYEAVDTVDQF
jgi:quinol monooxygenase YgiN